LKEAENGRLKMSATIAIEIPREIIHVTRMTPQALKRELALYLFEQDKLSFGKARELAEMTVWEFQQLLGSRGILIHYDVEDYEQDLVTLRELGQL
jgi:predicted HTH domain antitoxin